MNINCIRARAVLFQFCQFIRKTFFVIINILILTVVLYCFLFNPPKFQHDISLRVDVSMAKKNLNNFAHLLSFEIIFYKFTTRTKYADVVYCLD